MSWGEDDRGPIDHTVICDICKKKTEYWNCLINNGKAICDDCCFDEEKLERDRIQLSQAKAFKQEMERLNRRC